MYSSKHDTVVNDSRQLLQYWKGAIFWLTVYATFTVTQHFVFLTSFHVVGSNQKLHKKKENVKSKSEQQTFCGISTNRN